MQLQLQQWLELQQQATQRHQIGLCLYAIRIVEIPNNLLFGSLEMKDWLAAEGKGRGRVRQGVAACEKYLFKIMLVT